MLSVVIASCHDDACCYLSAHAAKFQLERAGIEHEIIVVADGGTPSKWENQGIKCLRVDTGSPQGTRTVGIRAAKYDDVLCLESHVVVEDIGELLRAHRELDGALTFPCRVAEGTEMFDVYGSQTDWESGLWYKNLVYDKPGMEPFRIAQFGHSAFVSDRDWFLANGGYTNLLHGWGGEEPFLCLKAWMLGRECWMVPTVRHAHYLTHGAHPGVTSSAEFARNMLTVAYVLGGNEQLEKARRHFALCNFTITPDIEAERQRICAGPFGGDLVKLREYMNENGVMN